MINELFQIILTRNNLNQVSKKSLKCPYRVALRFSLNEFFFVPSHSKILNILMKTWRVNVRFLVQTLLTKNVSRAEKHTSCQFDFCFDIICT